MGSQLSLNQGFQRPETISVSRHWLARNSHNNWWCFGKIIFKKMLFLQISTDDFANMIAEN
jgi:hypothetical protein